MNELKQTPEAVTDRLELLLIQCEKENKGLLELCEIYLSLMASGNREWFDTYNHKVETAINRWIDSYKIADPLHNIIKGFSRFFIGNVKESIPSFKAAIENTTEIELYRKLRGIAHMGLGTSYRSIGNIDLALFHVLTAAKYIDENDQAKDWHVFTFRIIAEIHLFIEEFDIAEKFYRKAEDILTKLEFVISQTVFFRVYDGLGNCYLKKGDIEKSRYYYEKAAGLSGISEAELARVKCDLGTLMIDDAEKSIPFLKESCEIRKKLDLEDAYSTSLSFLGEAFLKNGNLEDADRVLKEALPLIERYNVPVKKLHFYRIYARYMETIGNYSDGIHYYKLFIDQQKKVNSDHVKNIFRLKNKEIEKQNQEIRQKNEELNHTLFELAKIKLSRKSLIFSIITVVFLVIATEVFLDPLIESYTGNMYLSLSVKILIGFMLKPIDSIYERLLYRKAMK